MHHPAVVHQNRDENGAEAKENFSRHRSLTHHIVVIAHGVVEQSNQEGIGTFRTKILAITGVHLRPQWTNVAAAKIDIRNQPYTFSMLFNMGHPDMHRSRGF